MFSIACEGIPSPEIKVSTVIGSTRFWEPSLADLVAAVNTSSPEVNDDWTNLSLEASTISTERSVSITIDKERTELNIAGSDATWAYGQAARLEGFLRARGAVDNSPKYETKVSLIFLSFLVAVFAFWLLSDNDHETVRECVRRVEKSRQNEPYTNLAIGSLFAIGVFLILFKALKQRASRALLRVNGSVATGSWWSRLSVAEKIAAVGVPVATLATIGTLVSAANDVLGK
ncbi:hypothetical protein JK364_27970 [Streptomyces sp. 110]|uniref:Uncharacterized protein n=1 Tax=Streptomyces endocoffeicus TaxID=2898945 RepID=A0ABS1PV68_9ACTN|nr:hypothetical protein [Streptomyces endocoffeicus]MBL1116204.1 hypothetical protein [Streptomyces endocoffeicus]